MTADERAEAAERERDGWQARYELLEASSLLRAERERDALREALRFYGDEWCADMIGDGETPGLSHCFMRPSDALMSDGGDKARAALAPRPVSAS